MEMLESMQKDRLDVTVAYIDVNGLKMVNDTLGHPEGDQYLKIIANSLNESLNKSDILARVGGDEFLIVSNSTEKDALESMLSKVNERLKDMGREGYRPSAMGPCRRPIMNPLTWMHCYAKATAGCTIIRCSLRRG